MFTANVSMPHFVSQTTHAKTLTSHLAIL